MDKELEEKKLTHVTTTSGMSGHFAVVMEWNPDGFWEPMFTGFGRYETKAEALEEAKGLAHAEGLPLVP